MRVHIQATMMATMTMHRQLGLTAALVALIGIGACSDASAADKDLNHDLELATSSTTSPDLSLAPSAGRTEVVSTVERVPGARPAPQPAQQRSVVHHSPRQSSLAAAAPVTAAPMTKAAPVTPTPTPEPAAVVTRSPAPAVEPTPAPRPTPNRQAEPRGGWKSEGEVFRNAPFPITP